MNFRTSTDFPYRITEVSIHRWKPSIDTEFRTCEKGCLHGELLLCFYEKDYSQDSKDYVGDPGS